MLRAGKTRPGECSGGAGAQIFCAPGFDFGTSRLAARCSIRSATVLTLLSLMSVPIVSVQDEEMGFVSVFVAMFDRWTAALLWSLVASSYRSSIGGRRYTHLKVITASH